MLVAIDGICLTVTALHGECAAGFDVMQQRLALTTPGTLGVDKAYTKPAQRTILVHEATRRALGERARFEPMGPVGPVVLKGKSAAVEVFSLALAQKV